MAKKKKKKKPQVIEITLELPEHPEPEPSVADVFIYNFLRTLSYWITGFIIVAIFGAILSLI